MAPGHLDSRTLSSGIVNLTVGPSETPFDVHIELLCDRSPYFDNMLGNRYAESSSAELILPNETPETFADFVSWAYSGRISDVETAIDSSRVLHLFQLWTLAEKFHVPELQDIALQTCKEYLDANSNSLVPCDAVRHAYVHSAPGAAIRRLAVDAWAARAWKSDIVQARRGLLLLFLEDLRIFRPDTIVVASESQLAKRRIKSPSSRRRTSEKKISQSSLWAPMSALQI
ncbi:hypothetical protein BDW62DRAFT_206585 [Aspergillus aurantiobrunneus]